MVELQPLGPMHGHDLQTRLGMAGYMFLVEHRLEFGDVGQIAGNFQALNHIEKVIDMVDSVLAFEDGRPAQHHPGALHAVPQ